MSLTLQGIVELHRQRFAADCLTILLRTCIKICTFLENHCSSLAKRLDLGLNMAMLVIASLQVVDLL